MSTLTDLQTSRVGLSVSAELLVISLCCLTDFCNASAVVPRGGGLNKVFQPT